MTEEHFNHPTSEHDPIDPYDLTTKRYVDVVHQTAVEEGETGPTLGYRMGLRSAFVYWSGFEENVSGHGYFQVQVATDSGFTSILDDVSTKANWTTIEGLTSGTTYYFRVRAIDAAGHVGDWSSSVDDPPDLIIDDDVLDVSFNKVTTGSLAVGETASSTGFVTGVSGWQINGAGDAEFNDVTIRGTIDMRNASGYGIVITDTDEFSISFYNASMASARASLHYNDSVNELVLDAWGGGGSLSGVRIVGVYLELNSTLGHISLTPDSSFDARVITSGGGRLLYNGTEVSVSGHGHPHGHSGTTSTEDGTVGTHSHTITL